MPLETWHVQNFEWQWHSDAFGQRARLEESHTIRWAIFHFQRDDVVAASAMVLSG